MKKLLPLVAVFFLFACNGDDGLDDTTPVDPSFFNPTNALTGDAYEQKACETIFRALEMSYSMVKLKITFNDGRVTYYSGPEYGGDEYCDQFYRDLQQLAYSPNVKTRGVWSIGKSSIDWYKAITNVNKLYRCAIVGTTTQYLDKDQMIDIYNHIMAHKTEIFRDWGGMTYVKPEFEAEYFSTPGRFWYHFANGDLDSYAKRIYNQFYDMQKISDSGVYTDAIHELAFELGANDLTPNRLMLSAAGPLIEAGFNTVFAADDFAGAAKIGYDIINDNTKLILDLKADKLDTKTLMTAVNTNLNLLTTCIDKIIGFDNLTGIKDTQDLGMLIHTYCVENELDFVSTISKLNNSISETLTDMGKWTLHVSDVAYEYFEKEVKEILGIEDSPSDNTGNVGLGWYLHYYTKDGTDYQDYILFDHDGEISISQFTNRTYNNEPEAIMLEGDYQIKNNKIKIRVKKGFIAGGGNTLNTKASGMNKYYEGTIENYKDHINVTWHWRYEEKGTGIWYEVNFDNQRFEYYPEGTF